MTGAVVLPMEGSLALNGAMRWPLRTSLRKPKATDIRL